MECNSGIDTGLHALAAMARFLQLPVEPDQLTHQLGHEGQFVYDTQLLQATKAPTLNAKQPALRDQLVPNLPESASAQETQLYHYPFWKQYWSQDQSLQNSLSKPQIATLKENSLKPETRTTNKFPMPLWVVGLVAYRSWRLMR